MLSVLTASEEKRLEIIDDYKLSADSVVLVARDGDDTVGFVAFLLSEDRVIVTQMDAEDEVVVELMLRAAFNYGERRFLMLVESLVKEPQRVFLALGFREKDKKFVSSVTNVVHVCKNCAE
ncbi:MAG: hypothetical protein J6L81_08995 [Clostridia bacterium]|nr:hypothetical protein [Clostridia bacterium]